MREAVLTVPLVAERLGCTVRQACRVMRAAGGFYVGKAIPANLRVMPPDLDKLMSGALSLQPLGFDETVYGKDPVVYFVRGGELIKIGWSRHVRSRVMGMKIGSPAALTVVALALGGWELEAVLHAKYSEYHSHGEWFRYEGRLRELVDSLAARSSAA